MSRNAVLEDKDGNQVMPITVGDNVYYNEQKTVNEKIDEIISGAVVVEAEQFHFKSQTVLPADSLVLLDTSNGFDEMRIYIDATTPTLAGGCGLQINDNTTVGITIVPPNPNATTGIIKVAINIKIIDSDYVCIDIIGSDNESYLIQNENVDYVKVEVGGSPSMVFSLGSTATVFTKEPN